MPEEYKIGRRNNRTDAQKIQQLHDLSAELGAGCSTTKAVSLDERLSTIRAAIYAKMRAAAGDIDDLYDYAWIAYVYEDYAIVEGKDSAFIRIPYTEDSDGRISVADRDAWQNVERDWVVKALQRGYQPGMIDQPVITTGTALKVLERTDDAVKIGGYLVVYGTPTQTDLSPLKDYFTNSTDFCIEDAYPTNVWYQHGLDGTLKKRKIGKDGKLYKHDVGIWLEAQLSLRDAYEAALATGVEAGKMGLSSGTAPHLVERKAQPNGSHEITLWPLGLDASITPTPAEPRTTLGVLKSIDATANESGQAQAAQDTGNVSRTANADDATARHNPTLFMEIKSMDPKEKEKDGAPQSLTAEQVQGIIDAGVEAGVAKALSKYPALKSTGVSPDGAPSGDDTETRKTNAVKSFRQYVRTGNEHAAGVQVVDNDGNIKALGEQSASSGAVLVPESLHGELIVLRTEYSTLRAAGATVITKTNGQAFTVARMSAPSTPIAATAEHGTISEEDPGFGSVKFEPIKYPKITRVSDELLQDSEFPVESTVLLPYAAEKFAVTENIVFATGTGTGQPEGILTGSSLGATAASATVITHADMTKLFFATPAAIRNRCTWLVSDDAIAQLEQLTIGNTKLLQMDGDGNFRYFGRPLFTLSTLPSVAANAKPVLFGNLAYYWIVDFGGVDVKRLNEKYADTGEVGFRWQERIDAHVIHPAAIRHMVMAAA